MTELVAAITVGLLLIACVIAVVAYDAYMAGHAEMRYEIKEHEAFESANEEIKERYEQTRQAMINRWMQEK